MDITQQVKPPQGRRRRRRGGFFLRLIGFMFAAIMIVFIAAAGAAAFVMWKVSSELPDYEVLAKYEPPVMTRIHANDGALIAEFSRERRIYVPMTAIPACIIDAFISAEDKNFYQHGGLDVQGIIRAVVTNLSNASAGRRSVGASTITQQVAKNFLLSSDQTIERKLKEAILAIRIERAFTKEQILELYLNEIYLGVGAYGVAAAAQSYWDKALNELTLADCAYLATLPKAPSNYDPFKFADRAIARRNWVIDHIVENGFATKEEGEAAKAQPLGVIKRKSGPKIFASEYFAEEVRREILDHFGEDKLYGGGLSVRTTLDARLQRAARKALIDGFVAYDRRRGGWRGPVKQIEIGGDWGTTLAGIQVWPDIAPWRLAVVLEVYQGQGRCRHSARTHLLWPAREGARDRGCPVRRGEMGATEARARSWRGAGKRDGRAEAGRRHLRFAARARTRGRRVAQASAGRTQGAVVAQAGSPDRGSLGCHGSPFGARALPSPADSASHRASSTARLRRAASLDLRSSR